MVACRGRRSAEVARLTLIDGSRDGGFCAKPGEPSEVVGEIGETDLRRGSDLADGSGDEGRRHFCAAKTCSTRERTLARVALPRAMCVGIGLPLGLAR